jgi:serine-type D-Ala-D-Ala carboxypeptidase/endopeptidase (penicillin-binding protein 4)
MHLLAVVLACLLLAPAPADGVEAQWRRGELKGARLAVCVVDVDSGERLYAKDIDAPMAPASNMKLVTTAAALSRLGAEHLFATRLLSAGAPDERGLLAGDLVVLGGADPCLRADLLAASGEADPAALLADLIEAAGVRTIGGRLLLDDALLDRQWLCPDWKGGDIGNDYAAPVGALSLHGNCLSLDVRGGPPDARLATRAVGFRVVDELASAGGRTYEVGALRPDEYGAVVVRGRIGSGISSELVRVPVIDPADFFGRCLLAELAERGVHVGGGHAVEAGCAARAPHELGRLESPLVNAVLLANKESDNGLADHLFKYLGACCGGEGSFAGGERAVLEFLRNGAGTPVEGVVLRDGSGLSNRNRVTARLLTDVLAAMARRGDAAGAAFLRSLPVSGMDGSLRERMQEPPLLGAVRAKTGFISGVSCLSGYARTQAGRTLAFAVLINDYDPRYTNRQMKSIQDDICRALVTQR